MNTKFQICPNSGRNYPKHSQVMTLIIFGFPEESRILPFNLFKFKDWLVQLRYFIEENPEKPGRGRLTLRGTAWFKILPSLRPTARTWKWMVGILVSFWDGLFSGAILVLGSVSAAIKLQLIAMFLLWVDDFCSDVFLGINSVISISFIHVFSHGPVQLVNHWDWNRIHDDVKFAVSHPNHLGFRPWNLFNEWRTDGLKSL